MRAAADVELAKAKQSAAQVFAGIAKELGEGVDQAYNVIYRNFVLDVFDEWPVRTGFSKSQFDMLYSTRAQLLSADFVNYAGYSKFIQEPLPASEMTRAKKAQRAIAQKNGARPKIGNGVNIMRKVVFVPAEAVSKRMAEAIAKSGGGFRG